MQIKKVIVLIIVVILFQVSLLTISALSGGIMPRKLIDISSVPSGATIYVDGINTGKETPAAISISKPGTHCISLIKENFAKVTFNISISSDIEKIYINLLDNTTRMTLLNKSTLGSGPNVI